MTANCFPRLVADIGGTNARFALETAPRQLQHVQVLACADYPSLVETALVYLNLVGKPSLQHAAIAIANPIVGDWVQMTNHHWAFSIETTRQALGLETLLFINDFTAQALSIPHTSAAELVKVGGQEPVAGAAIGVIGPGTGLGVSGLIPTAQGFTALAGEGGHVSFSPFDDTEMYLWRYAQKQFGHVSAERFLSGAGLSLIYEALAQRDGAACTPLTAAQISALGLGGQSPLARMSLDIFSAMLGTAAANLALTLGARGGMYLVGGILPRLIEYFPTSPFRQRFENKGRFSAYLAAVPVYVVLSAQPGLIGAAVALAQHLGD